MAAKFILVPDELYQGLTSRDTGNINLDFVRNSLEKAKRERANQTSKNINYNQELARYLHMRNELENRPTRVQLTDGISALIKQGDEEHVIDKEARSRPPHPPTQEDRHVHLFDNFPEEFWSLSPPQSPKEPIKRKIADENWEQVKRFKHDSTSANLSNEQRWHLQRQIQRKRFRPVREQSRIVLAEDGKPIELGSTETIEPKWEQSDEINIPSSSYLPPPKTNEIDELPYVSDSSLPPTPPPTQQPRQNRRQRKLHKSYIAARTVSKRKAIEGIDDPPFDNKIRILQPKQPNKSVQLRNKQRTIAKYRPVREPSQILITNDRSLEPDLSTSFIEAPTNQQAIEYGDPSNALLPAPSQLPIENSRPNQQLAIEYGNNEPQPMEIVPFTGARGRKRKQIETDEEPRTKKLKDTHFQVLPPPIPSSYTVPNPEHLAKASRIQNAMKHSPARYNIIGDTILTDSGNPIRHSDLWRSLLYLIERSAGVHTLTKMPPGTKELESRINRDLILRTIIKSVPKKDLKRKHSETIYNPPDSKMRKKHKSKPIRSSFKPQKWKRK